MREPEAKSVPECRSAEVPAAPLGRAAEVVPLPFFGPPPGRAPAPPGDPPRGGRPRPGSIFNPGSSGPGISRTGEVFLDGALDPATGWPFVLLDHFAPRPERLE